MDFCPTIPTLNPFIVFNMKMPPSSNQLFIFSKNRRIKTAQYREWIGTPIYPCEPTNNFNHLNHVDSINIFKNIATKNNKKVRYRVSIIAGMGYRRDLDNIAKPTIDIMVKQNYISDDRYVDIIHLKRADKEPVGQGRIIVILEIIKSP